VPENRRRFSSFVAALSIRQCGWQRLHELPHCGDLAVLGDELESRWIDRETGQPRRFKRGVDGRTLVDESG
jgi:hypothetical protein